MTTNKNLDFPNPFCEYFEDWQWNTNDWSNFNGIIDLDLWSRINCESYSISESLMAEGKHIRQSSSVHSFGHVVLLVEPDIENKNIRFIWQIKDEKIIPICYMRDVFEGVVDEIIEHFHKTNIGITSMKITVCDGTLHEMDSNRWGYKIAAMKALRKVLDTAKFIRR